MPVEGASYHHVVLDGEENRDGTWYQPEPTDAACQTVGRVAFWRGVEGARWIRSRVANVLAHQPQEER